MAMTLRLTEEQTKSLRAAAERDGVSMQAVAIRAIEEYTSRRVARRDEMLRQIVEEDSEVLRRLADT
ncbi:MAG: CopG family transcriptional regulator [Acidimicrobiia bacterium]|nr:CopG family transcriptional regulator [Acidimicrobiia bacterium]